ncbi:hypothetical protein ABIE26_003003 [Pedobacter africanus]|uniref:hypothetical protein n=1 Tax=Pedobacter africanus TaxID=151894 RepID=UPI0033952AFD
MRFNLHKGQVFRISSNLAQKYETIFGQFSFLAEVVAVGEYRSWGTSNIVTRDLTLTVKDWGTEPYGQPKWFVCHCLALGHDKYGDPELNYSPNLIQGKGQWYVPDLMKWQERFSELWQHGLVELVIK